MPACVVRPIADGECTSTTTTCQGTVHVGLQRSCPFPPISSPARVQSQPPATDREGRAAASFAGHSKFACRANDPLKVVLTEVRVNREPDYSIADIDGDFALTDGPTVRPACG